MDILGVYEVWRGLKRSSENYVKLVLFLLCPLPPSATVTITTATIIITTVVVVVIVTCTTYPVKNLKLLGSLWPSRRIVPLTLLGSVRPDNASSKLWNTSQYYWIYYTITVCMLSGSLVPDKNRLTTNIVAINRYHWLQATSETQGKFGDSSSHSFPGATSGICGDTFLLLTVSSEQSQWVTLTQLDPKPVVMCAMTRNHGHCAR